MQHTDTRDGVDITRRRFLKASALGTGGLVLGIQLSACEGSGDVKALIRDEWSAAEGKPTEVDFFPNAYIRITPDNTVYFYLASSEMGQGVMTSLAMLLAEELEVELSQVVAEFAPAHSAFENPSSGKQSTGGSRSIRGFYQPLREAGALARAMLLQAAANKWNVPVADCRAETGFVLHGTEELKISYGELVELANKLPVPDIPELKSPEKFSLVGKPAGRLDSHDKANGSAVFGMDVTVPGMLVATVVKSPVFAGKLLSFSARKAKKVKGVVDIFEIKSGIAIVATGYWPASKARKLLKLKWDKGKNKNLDDKQIRQQFVDAIDADAKDVLDTENDVEAYINNASRKLHAVYETPYLAHACMEPMNCTAHVRDERCDVWAPTQSQESTQKTAAKITGLSRNKVYVHTTFLGGGFGRRGEQDFIADAVEISKHMKKPVKVIWSREDDMRNDFYRPATYNELSAAFSGDGELMAWQHKIASPPILERFVPFARLVLRGKDGTSLSGAEDLPYSIPYFKLTYAWVETGIPVGFWRSVGHSQNAYVVECFIDEVARTAGKDPYQFRLELLKDKPRHTKVLEKVATEAGWGKPLPEGRFLGIALADSFGSIVAQVAEVSVMENTVRIHKVTAAVDCGIAINPDTVIAQIEGGIVWGLTAALYGEINIQNGGVQQSNFHDYPMLQLANMPEVSVHIIASTEEPGGIGETGVPPAAPAVVNAVFAATGKPVRSLPIKLT